jgi:hypothetical protein
MPVIPPLTIIRVVTIIRIVRVLGYDGRNDCPDSPLTRTTNRPLPIANCQLPIARDRIMRIADGWNPTTNQSIDYDAFLPFVRVKELVNPTQHRDV